MRTVQKFYIAGVQFHELPQIASQISEGDELELITEPTNKFDPNAIRIELNGTMFGYVPKKFSAEISALLEISPNVCCIVTSIDPSAKPWEMCEVEILEGQEDVEPEEPDLEECEEEEEEECIEEEEEEDF